MPLSPANENLYKAGARFARSGGTDAAAKRTLVRWIKENGIKARGARHVIDGFAEEAAQIAMDGLSARHGRPFGRH